MRHRIRIAFALSTSLVLAVLATPSRGVNLPFTGTLAIQLAALPPISVSGSGVAALNGSGPSGHLTGLAIPGSAFSTAGLVLPFTDPAIEASFGGLELTVHNGSGVFGGVGGAGFGGAMPLQGLFKVCLLGPPCSLSTANLNVPLSVAGQAGTVTVQGPPNLTVIGAPWTTGTVAIRTLSSHTFTAMGGVSPLSNTGALSGIVTLVTPIFVSTSLATSFPVWPLFGILTLHFVPEPGTIVLLGSGIAGFAAAGRRARAPTPRS